MGLLDIFSKPKNDPMAKYSARIYFLAEKGTDELRALAEVTGDKTVIERLDAAWFSVFSEFQTIYFHMTEREAFSQVGNSGLPEIMNDLVLFSIDCSVDLHFRELPREECQAIKKDWLQYLNVANQVYGRCKKLVAGSNESPQGTVLGEFGLRVAEIIGRPGNSTYIDHCREAAWGSGIALLAKDYVQEFVQNRAKFNLHVENDSLANIRRWQSGMKELKRELIYAKEHWNDKDLRDAAIARARELDEDYLRRLRGDKGKN